MKRLLPAFLALALLVCPAFTLGEAAPSELPSGFDPATNQTITWCGVDFSVPAYYDALAVESTDTVQEYYSTSDESHLSLVFQVEPFDGTMADFEKALPQMVRETQLLDIYEGSEFHQSEAFVLAGLPGWLMRHTGINMEGGEDYEGVITFVFNQARGEILMLGLGYDAGASARQYDYLGDFQKIVESAKIQRVK